ncbi:MAG: hypothetical protein ACOYBY_05905 [Dermatophilaceae bacterium]
MNPPARPPAAPDGATRQPESYTWPIVAMLAAILPQVLVPATDRVGPAIVVPIVELLAVGVMVVVAAKPGPVPRGARPLILLLLSILAVANTAGAAHLVALALDGRPVDGAALTAGRLLVAGALAVSTNVLTFALLYWQVDRGGPAARAGDDGRLPDFQFPQDSDRLLAPADWVPRYGDYLYVAYTNLVAFSPTDTNPLTQRAKALMALQSMIALAVIVVVLSRVINILPTPSG